MHTLPSFRALTLLGAGAICTLARAQEAMYTAAATMPSPGTGVLRTQFHLFRFGTNPIDTESRQTDVYEFMTTIAYGLDRALALFVDVPLVLEREERVDTSGIDEDWSPGVEDIDAMIKWRFYKHDSGGIDTMRAALMGGAKFASGDREEFSSQSVNPHIGAVCTVVKGRHGFNQDLFYTWHTGGETLFNKGGEGPDDAVRFNTAYVYRIEPAAYSSETVGAWYTTIELNGLYETGGDIELRWSPGLMYEGRTWGFEVMAQLPLWSDLDERAELDFGVGFGFRFSF